MRTRLAICSMAALVAAATMSTGSAARVPWIPDSAGLPPLASLDQAGKPTFINPTRRFVTAGVPGRLLVGHSLFGLYGSVAGGGWVSLTPNCFSLLRPPLLEDIAGLLSGCGVEGLAQDPLDPLGLYASTYNIDLFGAGVPVTHGGIFRAELSPAGVSSNAGSGGILWRKILPGVRGNALAVRRASLTQQPTIVAGRIQKTSSDVGTDANSYCAPGCSPSVYVSTNGGRTWSAKTFAPAPCPDGQGNVFTSSRIVGNLAFDPVNSNVVYAGANSGLWVSADAGATWRNALVKCGTNPGFAVTEARDGDSQRIYVGTFDGKLFSGGTGPSGPSGLTEMTLTGARLEGQILTVLLDSRDFSERTMFVAAWTQPQASGGGNGGIYRVQDLGNGTADVERLNDSLLDFTKPLIPPDAPLPYPLSQDPRWRPSLFLAQPPAAPDLLYASTVLGGVWVRIED